MKFIQRLFTVFLIICLPLQVSIISASECPHHAAMAKQAAMQSMHTDMANCDMQMHSDTDNTADGSDCSVFGIMASTASIALFDYQVVVNQFRLNLGNDSIAHNSPAPALPPPISL